MFVATLDGSCALINITDDDSINWLNHVENPVFSTSFYAEQFTCIIVADVGGGISVLSRESGKCVSKKWNYFDFMIINYPLIIFS